jgi:pimeloyl-ACP methyl ester carboxylesterase
LHKARPAAILLLGTNADFAVFERRCPVPKAAANGIHIEYETIGDPAARPLLLINGLASQLIQWDDDIRQDLAQRGHYVISFDNRDAGLSTKCNAPYALDDMADDAVGLLDALRIDKAHVCGTSMGGMIAQTVAIRHPSKVKSLISIYSNMGSKGLPPPKAEVIELLLTPAPAEREAYIEYMVLLFRMMSGTGFAFDETWARMIAGRAYDRSFSPGGTARQVNAVMNQVDRKKALSSVTVPTLVIHGTDDPVVPWEAGRDTAEAIPRAELMLIDGMGHDLPHGGAWPRIVEAIAAHTSKASP